MAVKNCKYRYCRLGPLPKDCRSNRKYHNAKCRRAEYWERKKDELEIRRRLRIQAAESFDRANPEFRTQLLIEKAMLKAQGYDNFTFRLLWELVRMKLRIKIPNAYQKWFRESLEG